MRRETEIKIEIQQLELTIGNYKRQKRLDKVEPLEAMISALKWVIDAEVKTEQ